jgi:hypothetical protein
LRFPQEITMNRFSHYDSNLQPVAGGSAEHVFTADHQQNMTFVVDLLGGEEVNADHAEKLATECRLGGFEDWRLPTVEEEFVIRDRTRLAPAMNPADFPRQPAYGWVWTSTPWADAASAAWIVLLGDGGAGYYRRYGSAFVRAVRSGVPSGQ